MYLAANMTRMANWLGAKALLAGLVLVFGTRFAQAASPQVLPGHVPAVIDRLGLKPVGRLPLTNRLELAISLPLRNTNELNQLLQDLYDPQSPTYHQFLTSEDFTARFGPTEADYAAVMAYARSNGLAVTGTHPNRALVDVGGTVGDIERALHVTLRTYQHPREPRNFFAPDTDPSPELAVPLAGIRGLDNYALPHPALVRPSLSNPGAAAAPALGSGTNGTYMGPDFRAAYAPDVALTGVGQAVALVQFDGFYPSDIAAYESSNNLPNVPVQTVLVDSFSGTPTTGPNSGNVEVSLDIEMVISMAPGISNVIVYEGPNTTAAPADVLNRIATDNAAKQISCSWINFTAVNSAFLQMAAQGQSFFNAAGDNDAGEYVPADSPYLTAVGGTALTTTGPGGARVSETAWNRNNDTGTGGGISTNYAIPAWQTNVSMTLNHGSTSMRNFPDVAMAAENVLVFYSSGGFETVGGTSCASPLWAAFTALVNEQAAQGGHGALGLINAAVYKLGGGTNYAATFHDITTGSNTNSSDPTNYFAVAGYDLCTGWGTPTGQKLINAMVSPPVPVILPDGGFTSSRYAQSAFTGTNEIFTLTNNGSTTLNWSLVNTSAWLDVSVSSGTLAAGATATTVVSLDAAATNLAIGTYTAGIVFSNRSTGLAQTRVFTVQVTTLVINGGFESGDLTGWTLVGDGVIGRTLYDGVISSSSVFGNCTHSGTYGMGMGDNQIAYLYQTVPTTAGQSYLLSFWLESLAAGTVQQFIVNWNTNAAATNQIYNQTFTTALAWTNLQFLVTAGGPATVLQFGAQNDPDLFGLDDVSLTPVTQPVFQNLAKTNGAVQLSWSATAGLVYQLQTRTNLTLGAWLNVGGPFTATNPSLSAFDTNTVPAGGQRYYRLLVEP